MSREPDDGVPGVPVELDDVDTRPIVVNRHILVVDDNAAELVAMQAALEPLARQVVIARSGQDALAHLLEQDFAVVLLDVNMPEMDGFETAHWIRSRERTQHLPIIFTSADKYDSDAVLRAYTLGAVDFLFKPLIPEVLRAKTSVFVTLQERTEQLAAERMERDFENRRREFETAALRRERDREAAANLELARLNEALAANDRRKDSFIAILAHELRNPLAPIRTCVDLIAGDPSHAVTSRMLDVLDRQTGVLARLVEDLLDLSRIKADKIELRPETIDIAEVIEAAIATSQPLIDERRHTLVIQAAGEPVVVVADTVRLTQVLCNVINNAARYTPPGGRIEVASAVVGDDAVVRVTDNGIGIPAELQDSVFNMFVQERVRSDGSGGLGLGLALSRRLVEMHKGTIAVTSNGRDQGSAFELRIPLSGTRNAVPQRRRTGSMAPVALDDATRCGSVRTVVIDDNEDARELLSELLRARGFEVVTAADGLTGLEIIRETRPDVALVDLGLPGLDGFGVVEQLRAQCPDLRTRLVALTGYGAASDAERTSRAGFHAHLVKPATAAAIVACVTEQLSR